MADVLHLQLCERVFDTSDRSNVHAEKDANIFGGEVVDAVTAIISCKLKVKNYISQIFFKSFHKRSRLISKSVG